MCDVNKCNRIDDSYERRLFGGLTAVLCRPHLREWESNPTLKQIMLVVSSIIAKSSTLNVLLSRGDITRQEVVRKTKEHTLSLFNEEKQARKLAMDLFQFTIGDKND